MIKQEQFKMLLPVACEWAEEQENLIIHYGIPLSPAQTADALKIGVEHPENIRLLKVPRIPFPTYRAPCRRTHCEVRNFYPGGLLGRPSTGLP